MARIEDLTPNASVRGILPDRLTVVMVQWFGSEALELTYKDPTGHVANQLLYRQGRASSATSRNRPAMKLRWRWLTVPPRVRTASNSSRSFFQSNPNSPYVTRR